MTAFFVAVNIPAFAVAHANFIHQNFGGLRNFKAEKALGEFFLFHTIVFNWLIILLTKSV